MTDWVAQDDWSQVKVGDTVRATRNDDAITYEVVDKYIAITGDAPYALVVRPVGLTWQTRLDRNVWSLSVPAKPAVELPTEPGYYLNTHSELAVRQINGSWRNDRDITIGPMEMEARAPYKKLEPVAVTAMKVLEDVSKFAWADGFMPQLRELSNKYGVTND